LRLPSVTRLNRGDLLRLDDAAGRTVAVFKGMVWITQDGDSRDAFVGRGQTFRIDRSGMALLEALDDASLIVFDDQDAKAADERAPA
jgi:hypothetical protein